jgi:hypothetical protein
MASLGRSDSFVGSSNLAGGRAGDSGSPRGLPRRGTPSACAFEAHAPDARRPKKPLSHGDTSFARSSDPCTSIVTPLWRREPTEVTHLTLVSRSGKSLAREKEPAPGLAEVDDARLAARHRSLKRSSVMRQKRKVVAATVPARSRESWSKCPHVVDECLQKSVGAFRPRIRSRRAPQKGWRRE